MSHLLINEPPLLLSPSLAAAIGVNEAIVVQQVWFWTRLDTAQVRDGHRWVYNTYADWVKQFPFWTERGVRNIFSRMVERKLLIVDCFNRSPMDQTRWYRVNMEELGRLCPRPADVSCGCSLQPASDDASNRHAVTHLTTENTTENTTEREGSRRRRSLLTFSEFLLQTFGSIEVELPASHPAYKVAIADKLPQWTVDLYWAVWCDKYLHGNRKEKKYKDWMRTFLQAFKDDWFGLFYHDKATNSIELTSDGRIARNRHMEPTCTSSNPAPAP